MAQLNEQKFHAFIGKMLGDLGGAFSVPTTRIGFRLGLFDALNAGGPATAAELAARAGGLAPRYVREWALAQASNGYIDFDAGKNTFSISPEQAMIFVNKDSPVYLAGAFDAAAMIEGEPKVEQAFRDGSGVRWGDSAGCLFCATGAFFRPGYVNNIAQTWIPALEGVTGKLGTRAKVADIGCGVGFSTILMAQAYPNSQFVGFDFHEPSIVEGAQARAASHGVSERVRFEVATAKEIAESDFDLVTMYDCLHDMGIRAGCAPSCTQDPQAGWHLDDRWADCRGHSRAEHESRRSPVLQRVDHDLCAHFSLDQEVGEGLGAQAGQAKLSEIVGAAGFSKVRRATEGPFNMILEARI